MNRNFHTSHDDLQRFLNHWTRGSYVQPHRHREPETLVVLEGTLAYFTFDDTGKLEQCYLLGPSHSRRGIDVSAGVLHSMTAYDMAATVWEVKLKVAGEYKVETNKAFLEGTPPGPMMGEAPSPEAVAYVEKLLAACSDEDGGDPVRATVVAAGPGAAAADIAEGGAGDGGGADSTSDAGPAGVISGS